MMLDDLQKIIPPPLAPIETSGASWQAIEAELGTLLPEDYKSFVEAYGSGRIGGFIWILNPFSERENLNLLNQVPRQLAALKELAKDFSETRPYPLYPVPGGLLPFSITDNGDVLHWRTSGKPCDWGVIVNDARSAHYEIYDVNMASFLVGVLTGKLHCPVFPAAFPPGSPEFEAK